MTELYLSKSIVISGLAQEFATELHKLIDEKAMTELREDDTIARAFLASRRAAQDVAKELNK